MLLLRLEALLLLTLPSELSMRRFLGSFGLRERDQTGFSPHLIFLRRAMMSLLFSPENPVLMI